MKPCQIHPGRPNNKGYVSRPYEGRMEGVHRIVWMELIGPIPPGHEIDHECGNRACVEIEHLRLVTHRQNLMLGNTIVAANAAKTHCPQGHPYDAANTYTSKQGKRQCRTCNRQRRR